MIQPAPLPADDEWPIAELRRQLGDLDGWMLNGLTYPGVPAPSAGEVAECAYSEDSPKDGAWYAGIGSKVVSFIVVNERRPVHGLAYFIKPFDPDLSTFRFVRDLLARRLGTDDRQQWRAEWDRRVAELDPIVTYVETISRLELGVAQFMQASDNEPLQPNIDEEVARQYRASADEQFLRNILSNLTLEDATNLYRDAASFRMVHGREAYLDLALDILCPPDDELAILNQIDDTELRRKVNRLRHRAASKAYRLGRRIRENEIVASHGAMVAGDVAYRKRQGVKAKKRGEQIGSRADAIYTAMVTYFQPMIDAENRPMSIPDLADLIIGSWPENGFPWENDPQSVPYSRDDLIRRIIPKELRPLGLKWIVAQRGRPSKK